MRIFVTPSELRAGDLAIRGDEHHYLGRVRRAAVGDRLELVDGEGRRAQAEIIAMTDDATTVRVFEPYEIPAPWPLVRVLLPLIKGDRMDYALEKLVEVGVDAIVVWPAARSVVKLEPDRRDARIAKYQLAVQAAARQSGRAQVPSVTWAESLAAAIAPLDRTRPEDDAGELVRLVLDPASDAAISVGEARDVTLVGGPEGGFAPDELAQLASFTPVGLGPRVLRAETAPVAAVAILRAQTRS